MCRAVVFACVVVVVGCAPVTPANPDGGASDGGQACAPGTLDCAGDTVVRCSASGEEWVLQQSCESGCEAGACLPCPCVEDGLSCDGDAIVRCSVEPCSREVVSICDFGCTVGSGGVGPSCRICTCLPGTSRCVGGTNRREFCADDCQGWQVEDCGALLCTESTATGATTAACGPEACGCVPGTVSECSIDGTGWTTCDANCGLQTLGCAGGCVVEEGVVTCRACVPESRTCDGNTLVTCNAIGSGASRFPCPGACAAVEGGAACID